MSDEPEEEYQDLSKTTEGNTTRANARIQDAKKKLDESEERSGMKD